MPTALNDTDHIIGMREDLTDVITMISPTETPFLSSIGRTRAAQVNHEWQTFDLAAAASSGANAVAEGASAVAASGSVTTRLGNRTQIFEKTIRVSNTMLSVNLAGRQSEWTFQMNAKAKELARDMENQLIQSSAQAAGDVSAETARQLEGLGLGGAADATATGGYTSANREELAANATDRANMTETNFNNLLQTIWAAGGMPDTVLCNGYLKRVISNFSANATRYSSVDFGNKQLNAAVDVYQSDFGQIQIKLDRYVAVTKLGIIQTEYFKLAELRPVEFSRLAKTGDRELGQFVTEVTLAAYAPSSSGRLQGAASASGATATT